MANYDKLHINTRLQLRTQDFLKGCVLQSDADRDGAPALKKVAGGL